MWIGQHQRKVIGYTICMVQMNYWCMNTHSPLFCSYMYYCGVVHAGYHHQHQRKGHNWIHYLHGTDELLMYEYTFTIILLIHVLLRSGSYWLSSSSSHSFISAIFTFELTVIKISISVSKNVASTGVVTHLSQTRRGNLKTSSCSANCDISPRVFRITWWEQLTAQHQLFCY